MPDVYQHAVADGSPKWSVGTRDFATFWAKVYDDLRFHRGEGFEVAERGQDAGPPRRLSELQDILYRRLTSSPDMVFEVSSRRDAYRELVRLDRQPETDKGLRVIQHALAKLDTPYHLGGTDCSWLTQHCYGLEGVELPHNAHLQHLLGITIEIGRAQIQPGDLLFHHDDEHVSIYLDGEGAGRVIDTEPHSTGAPSGWPTPTTGVGVQIRPMNSRWYTDWEHVNGICRVSAINGAP